MVYLSSMEMYGSPDPSLDCVTEQDYGFVDVLNVRSCYPEGKRMCECLCAAYAKEYQLPVKIARLAQTFGAVSVPEKLGSLLNLPEAHPRRGHCAPHRREILWQLLRHL